VNQYPRVKTSLSWDVWNRMFYVVAGADDILNFKGISNNTGRGSAGSGGGFDFFLGAQLVFNDEDLKSLLLFGGGDLPTIILVLGLPCAAGLIRGGVLLLRRDSTNVLTASAVLSVVVLLFTLLAGFLSDDRGQTVGITLFVVLAAVLPIVTACLAVSSTVRGWMESLD